MIFGNDASGCKDLGTNPFEEGEVDAEQVPSLGLPSIVRVLNQVSPMLTLGQRLGPPTSILT